jgi:Flp pilus assembly protein TadD
MPPHKDSTPEGTAEANYRRENALRPNRYLGYNHNTLAVHLIGRGAYAIAESELRRAIWLNPYEPVFLANLAWCLHKQGHDDEAGACMQQALEMDPGNAKARRIGGLLGFAVECEIERDPDESQR